MPHGDQILDAIPRSATLASGHTICFDCFIISGERHRRSSKGDIIARAALE